ncbi:MAG TPA: ABC transporter substrate-binding protein [Acidimicrobiales bacterium]
MVGVRTPRRRRGGKALAATAGLALLVLPACGLRVNSSTVRAADQAAVGTGGGGTPGLGAGPNGQAANSTGTTVAGGLPGVAGGPVGGSGPSASGGAAAGSGGGSNPASGGGANNVSAAAPAGGNGGATDVGVTADTITIGNVSDLGGPVPGLFQGGPYGTQAYINYINGQGGIYGRKLKLVTADDQLQCSQNEADYQNLLNQVFAFVGSWSLDDYCGAQIMAQHPNIPLVNQALSVQAMNLPSAYNEAPYGAGAPLGYLEYFKSKYPDAITSVGTIVGNQPSAVQSWDYYKAAMQSIGYKVTYEDDFPPAQSNFTADVIRMRSAGVKMVFIIAVNAPDLAAFSQEAYQQGFKPEVFVAPVGYFGSYVSEAGGPQAVEGQYVPSTQSMFLGEDAATVPEVATFDHWIKSSFPSFAIDQFSATSWANTALFVQALKAAGAHLTRQGLLTALSQIHSFNDNGLMSPTDIGAKKPGTCYLLLQIRGGKYTKVDDPPTGFRCGSYFNFRG